VYSHERETMIGKLKAYELAVSDTDSLGRTQAPVLSPAELVALKEKVDKRTKQLDLEQQLIDQNGHITMQLQWFVHGLMLVGLLLLILGIVFWYSKVQRFQNRLLRFKTRKKLTENQ